MPAKIVFEDFQDCLDQGFSTFLICKHPFKGVMKRAVKWTSTSIERQLSTGWKRTVWSMLTKQKIYFTDNQSYQSNIGHILEH